MWGGWTILTIDAKIGCLGTFHTFKKSFDGLFRQAGVFKPAVCVVVSSSPLWLCSHMKTGIK